MCEENFVRILGAREYAREVEDSFHLAVRVIRRLLMAIATLMEVILVIFLLLPQICRRFHTFVSIDRL